MDAESELLKGNTPTIVLSVLNAGPRHTYEIGRVIKEWVGEALPFKRGTLYPVLHALERDGLVTGQWETDGAERPRRVYTITDTGRAELARRTAVWERFSQAMNSLVGGPHGEGMPDASPA